MSPFASWGMPMATTTRRPDPVMLTSWMTAGEIPDTVAGLFDELTTPAPAGPRWMPTSVLDIAEFLPPPNIDDAEIISPWPTPPDWHAAALCAMPSASQVITIDTWFFGTDDVGGTRPSLPPQAVEKAREICYVCPSRVDCLLWALQGDERFGIWAGTTGRQRTNMRGALRSGRVTLGELVALYG